jgi:hypothetical protein
LRPMVAMEETKVVSDHDSNDPEQILKNPLDAILIRLREDSTRLKSLGAVDQAVLRGAVDRKDVPKSERDERLEEALSCVEAKVRNVSQARHAIDEILSRY